MTKMWVAAAAAAAGALAPSGASANPFDCAIEPYQVVELRSAVEGTIDKVLVKRGDRVKAGQPLVLLESSAEQSALALARFRTQMEGRISSSRNRADYAGKKLDRTSELHRQNYAAGQQRDEAEAEKRIAEAELKEALENRELAELDVRHSTDLLARRTLRSPFNGVVVDRLLNPGDLAEAGAGRKPILKLAQVEPLRVEVVLPLAAWGKVRAGSPATVTPETLGGRYPATTVVADSVFDSASGTFGARLELANPQGTLPAGIRCKVEFAQWPAAAAAAKAGRP